jgi:hypothetical protein
MVIDVSLVWVKQITKIKELFTSQLVSFDLVCVLTTLLIIENTLFSMHQIKNFSIYYL